VGLVLAALIILSGVSPIVADPGAPAPEALTSLAWVGRAGPDDVVFRLWVSADGSLSGEAHTLRGGKHATESPATQVVWEDPDLDIHLKTGVIFRGRLDAAGRRIDGRLEYQGKTVAQLPLDGVDPNGVPGLLARPAPPPGQPVYSYSVPAETGDGLQPAGPGTIGLESADLESLVTDVIEGKAGLLHSLLVAHGGELILEEYFHGYDGRDLHRVASVTKSVSSLITGIAIDRGEIAGVDTPLSDFFPQYKDAFNGEWKNVTLEHLLTMTIGTAWTDEEADRTHGTGDAFFRELLSRSFAHHPGEQWQYVSANVNLLGGVIYHATGMHADEFAARYLFHPLGIEEWNWDYGMVDGYRMMDGSLQLRPRDMVKIGTLVANRGTWNGARVVSAEWIEQSTAPLIATSQGAPEKYGYLWWRFYIPSRGGVREAVVANGLGSQFIVVFPAFDLVVVTTGSNDENGMQFAIGKLLSARVLDKIQVEAR